MLLRLDAGGAGGVLAEIQEAADFVAESGEGLVVDCMAIRMVMPILYRITI